MNPDFIDDNAQKAVAESFLRNYPEYFDESGTNARLMAQGVRQLVEAGRPFNTDCLALVFNHLRASGQLEEPPEPEPIEVSDEEFVRQRTVTDFAKYADNMTDSQLENALLGLNVWVPKTGGRVWREE
jgi:hypothetical protein